MDLTAEQKGELATSLAVLALYDGEAEINTEQINALLNATNNTVEPYLPVLFANFLSSPEKVMELICTPGGSGGGGGGAGGGAEGGAEEAQAEEEAKEETKRATRQYARRQETWFSRDERITWVKKAPISQLVSTIISSTIGGT